MGHHFQWFPQPVHKSTDNKSPQTLIVLGNYIKSSSWLFSGLDLCKWNMATILCDICPGFKRHSFAPV